LIAPIGHESIALFIVFPLSAEPVAEKFFAFFTDARIRVRFCGKSAFTPDSNKVRRDFALFKN